MEGSDSLKVIWEQEHETWSVRGFNGKLYVYIWADGVYFNVRSDDAKQCILVIVGETELGEKSSLLLRTGIGNLRRVGWSSCCG